MPYGPQLSAAGRMGLAKPARGPSYLPEGMGPSQLAGPSYFGSITRMPGLLGLANAEAQGQNPGASVSTGNLLMDLYNSLSGQKPMATTSTETSKLNTSAPLEQQMADFTNTLRQISQNTEAAYGQKQASYDALAKALSDMYRTQGSAAASGAQSGALASGLTPMEASQMGAQSLQDVMQQYFPALAGLRSQQADVPIALQGALAGLQGSLALPMMAQVSSPYYRGVAGGITNRSEMNPMAHKNLLAQLAGGIESGKINEKQLQMGQEASQQNSLQEWLAKQAEMEQETKIANLVEYGATIRALIGAGSNTGMTYEQRKEMEQLKSDMRGMEQYNKSQFDQLDQNEMADIDNLFGFTNVGVPGVASTASNLDWSGN